MTMSKSLKKARLAAEAAERKAHLDAEADLWCLQAEVVQQWVDTEAAKRKEHLKAEATNTQHL